jgi:Polysaccharide deacetylase
VASRSTSPASTTACGGGRDLRPGGRPGSRSAAPATARRRPPGTRRREPRRCSCAASTTCPTSSRAGWARGRAGSAWGGTAIDAPAAAVTASGGLDVVVRATDNALWSRWQRNGAWSAWSRAWVPAAPAAPPSSRLGVDWTRIPTTAPVVALTFDAGANADAIPSILTTLRTKNVPATFFLRVGAGLPRPGERRDDERLRRG